MTQKGLTTVLDVYIKILETGKIKKEHASSILKEQGVEVSKKLYASMEDKYKAVIDELDLLKKQDSPDTDGHRGRKGALEKIKTAYPSDAEVITAFIETIGTKVFSIGNEEYKMNPLFFRRVDANAPKRFRKSTEVSSVEI